MKNNLKILLLSLLVVIGFSSCELINFNPDYKTTKLEYKQVDEANPLKGFTFYKPSNERSYDTSRNTIPSSLVYWYIPIKDVFIDENTIDIDYFENGLNEIQRHNKQAIIRVFCDNPSMKELNGMAIPQFFLDAGIEKISYNYTVNGKDITAYFPDYTNPKCMDFLNQFIKLFGQAYDGDPRIAYVACGLVGHWGEWHNTHYKKPQKENPEYNKMPSRNEQIRFFETYSKYFTKTLVMARYPSDVLNTSPNIGFHDDSLTYYTLETENWYFYPKMVTANQTERWKTTVIGGEFRPENQIPFMQGTKWKESCQDYDECIQTIHCTWMIFNYVFNLDRTETEKKAAWEAAKKVGYDLYCSEFGYDIKNQKIYITTTITNKGIAPFYYDWKPKIVLYKNGTIIKEWDNPYKKWNLPEILPGISKEYTCELYLQNLNSIDLTDCELLLVIPNPMENGIPLKLSNESLNKTLAGYITLTRF